MSKVISVEKLLPLITEAVDSGGTFRLFPDGVSMSPLIRGGKDSVVLARPALPLNCGDIALFTSRDGRYLLHRVVGRDENGYIMRGDNCIYPERGVTDKDIIAVVTEIHRGSRVIRPRGAAHAAYCRIHDLRHRAARRLKRRFKR